MNSRKFDIFLFLLHLFLPLFYFVITIKCFIELCENLSRGTFPFTLYLFVCFGCYFGGFIERCLLCGLVQDFKDLFFPEES